MTGDDKPFPPATTGGPHVVARSAVGRVLAVMLPVCCAAGLIPLLAYAGAGTAPATADWSQFLPPGVLLALALLLMLSAFFSSCETAFLSIQKPRLRSLREEKSFTAQSVVRLLDDPARLLTTILVGNMLVNTLISVVLGTRVKDFFATALHVPAAGAYIGAVALTTSVLLFLGEIAPKVFAVRTREAYARIAVVPLLAADRLLAPLRGGLLRVTDFLFRVSHFHDLRAAPFITDEELKSVLADDQTTTEIEDEGREMIRGILEFRDIHLGEILIPRPDVVALPEDATVAEAHVFHREYEYSRIPIYQDDLDHITGVLSVKDLLSSLAKGLQDEPVKKFARPPHFAPRTMSVYGFIKDVQRHRAHLVIVVDEFGGTEGIVTLHDAIENVVGDIRDEDDEEKPPYERVAEGVYRVQGGLSLDELSDLIHVTIEDEEHNTVAGFLMDRTEKVPEVGDQIRHLNVLFTVEAVEGRRASAVRIEILPETEGDNP